MKGKLSLLIAFGALVFATGALADVLEGTAGSDHLRGTMRADVMRAFGLAP